MRSTIDDAGRIVIPKTLRDEVGLRAGEVEIVVDGAGVRIESLTNGGLRERNGRLVIDDDTPVTAEEVRRLRFADQR